MPFLFAVIFVLFSGVSSASVWQEKSQTIFQKQISKSKIKKSQFGLWVKRGSEISQINGDKQYVPASLSKIPTALSFLDKFPMNHKFHTWVYKTGNIQNGVLKGDLYLKGGGDPSFVSESLWLLINKLKRSDIKKVEGQLYVDESYFDSDYYSNGRQNKRVDRAYDAPVSALSFNWNSISVYVRPGSKAGEASRVYIDPPVPFVKIVNKSKTTSDKKTSIRVDRKIKGDGLEIYVTGKISTSKEEKAIYKSISQPAQWAGMNFKYYLNQFGIEYSGDVKKAVTPSNADQLVDHESWSMVEVVSAMSKFSNNFVAEMLTKHLGKKEREPANIKQGIDEIVHFLKAKGWKEGEFNFVNPSGFTRNNTMRADRLGELLDGSINDFKTSPEFLASLPISGVDGTLKRRMTQVMKTKVRAKTGYLTGIVGLAGYLESRRSKEPMTFVFFYNGPSKNDWEVRALFDRILWRLYQES